MLTNIDFKYLEYKYRPCVWENFSCSIDSIILMISIISDVLYEDIIENINEEYKNYFEILIKYCKKKDYNWEEVKDARNNLFGLIKIFGNLDESGHYDIFDLLKTIFKTDDVEIKFDSFYICQKILSDKEELINLGIVYNKTHFAIIYDNIIYDSAIESDLEKGDYDKIIYIGY